ncbi:MAG: GNAT family N-acetyltransferase [Pyrinomonadaceae bacterium]|nr:GNAT family N-acetyltransferase [Phycisphaerales bacterium]
MTSFQGTIEQLSPRDAAARCEPILRSIPEWFGIEESTRGYLEATARLPTWVARMEGRDAGFVTIERHFTEAADIHCIAVHRDFHGRGIGSALVAHAQTWLAGQGVKFLQVKTMGPSKPNREYALTLRFYLRAGFTPLEELHGLWPGFPCLILIKSLEPVRA